MECLDPGVTGNPGDIANMAVLMEAVQSFITWVGGVLDSRHKHQPDHAEQVQRVLELASIQAVAFSSVSTDEWPPACRR